MIVNLCVRDASAAAKNHALEGVKEPAKEIAQESVIYLVLATVNRVVIKPVMEVALVDAQHRLMRKEINLS